MMTPPTVPNLPEVQGGGVRALVRGTDIALTVAVTTRGGLARQPIRIRPTPVTDLTASACFAQTAAAYHSCQFGVLWRQGDRPSPPDNKFFGVRLAEVIAVDAEIRRANRIPQASCSRLTLPEEQIRLDYRNVLKSPSTPRFPKGDVERDFSGPLQATHEHSLKAGVTTALRK